MSKQIVEAIEKGFALVFGKQSQTAEIKLGSIMSADEQIKYEFDGEMLAVGSNIWVTADDGTKVPLPSGEYALENGQTVVVKEEGLIDSLADAPVPDKEEEPAQMATPQTNNVYSDHCALKSSLQTEKSSLNFLGSKTFSLKVIAPLGTCPQVYSLLPPVN